jgi:hypothetical protein
VTTVVRLIGWDAAVDPRNNAVVTVDAVFRPAREDRGACPAVELRVENVVRPRGREDLVEALAESLRRAGATLVCIDAPLGWPSAMAAALAGHRAGDTVGASADELFRRMTDHEIKRRIGKTPLDVGADRIARATRTTLEVLGEVRRAARHDLRLALDPAGLLWPPAPARAPEPTGGTWVLETYPGGWFASERIHPRGYRRSGAHEVRRALLHEIESHLAGRGISVDPAQHRGGLLRRADDVDAFVCVLCGVDALLGLSPAPTDRKRAEVEGWIWCKTPSC